MYLGKYWRAGKANMDNHQTGKSTELLVSKIKLNNGLSNLDFTKNKLKRYH